MLAKIGMKGRVSSYDRATVIFVDRSTSHSRLYLGIRNFFISGFCRLPSAMQKWAEFAVSRVGDWSPATRPHSLSAPWGPTNIWTTVLGTLSAYFRKRLNYTHTTFRVRIWLKSNITLRFSNPWVPRMYGTPVLLRRQHQQFMHW